MILARHFVSEWNCIMRAALSFLVCLLAIASIQAISVEDYRQLLTRTGLGVRPTDLIGCENLSYEQAVKHILDSVRTEAQTPAPNWINEDRPEKPRPDLSAQQKQEL